MDEIEIHMSALSGKSTVHHLLNLLFLCGLCLPRRSLGEGWCLCERFSWSFPRMMAEHRLSIGNNGEGIG